MIAYQGHPQYRFAYVSNERGAAKGYLVGIVNPWHHEVVCPPEGHADQYGHTLALELGLKTVVIDGLGIDGDGVFHGTPPRRVVDLDYSGIFHKNGDCNDRKNGRSSPSWELLGVAEKIVNYMTSTGLYGTRRTFREMQTKVAEIISAN